MPAASSSSPLAASTSGPARPRLPRRSRSRQPARRADRRRPRQRSRTPSASARRRPSTGSSRSSSPRPAPSAPRPTAAAPHCPRRPAPRLQVVAEPIDPVGAPGTGEVAVAIDHPGHDRGARGVDDHRGRPRTRVLLGVGGPDPRDQVVHRRGCSRPPAGRATSASVRQASRYNVRRVMDPPPRAEVSPRVGTGSGFIGTIRRMGLEFTAGWSSGSSSGS